MANLNALFDDFNSKIRLTDNRKAKLKKSRKAIRAKIRKYFQEQKPDDIFPKFSSQGSFMMDTNINPIPRKETANGLEVTLLPYDLDDGVYFIRKTSSDRKSSIQSYHNWIFNAVDDHTETPSVDKNTCVRVYFKDGHHIDLPIYFIEKEGYTPELAHKAEDWIKSDPKAFIDWFEEKVKNRPQLRRIVRFAKAWCDFQEYSREDKPMPSGFIFTIWIAENFYEHERDDVAMKETFMLIRSKLQKSWDCKRPTTPVGEDILASYMHKEYFMGQLNRFISNAEDALKEPNKKKASEYWIACFGDRFPKGEDKNEDKRGNSGLIAGIGGSKPFGY
ncbi:MAG: hypothetical protein K1X92_11365 [Bacteroidia bacterium]|nr:hypothetical protein [Bacteroidia bacterium]